MIHRNNHILYFILGVMLVSIIAYFGLVIISFTQITTELFKKLVLISTVIIVMECGLVWKIYKQNKS